MDTLGDVWTHTDAVVLATVLAEREGTGRGPIFEGEPLVWWSITVRNDRTLWQKQGAPVPPETFETGGGGLLEAASASAAPNPAVSNGRRPASSS